MPQDQNPLSALRGPMGPAEVEFPDLTPDLFIVAASVSGVSDPIVVETDEDVFYVMPRAAYGWTLTVDAEGRVRTEVPADLPAPDPVALTRMIRELAARNTRVSTPERMREIVANLPEPIVHDVAAVLKRPLLGARSQACDLGKGAELWAHYNVVRLHVEGAELAEWEIGLTPDKTRTIATFSRSFGLSPEAMEPLRAPEVLARIAPIWDGWFIQRLLERDAEAEPRI